MEKCNDLPGVLHNRRMAGKLRAMIAITNFIDKQKSGPLIARFYLANLVSISYNSPLPGVPKRLARSGTRRIRLVV